MECGGPVDRLAEPVLVPRVGTGEDQDVAPLLARVACGADALHRLAPVHHLLAAGVAAALGRELILDHHRREAGRGVPRHRALHVEGVAVAGVAVADHRKRGRRADLAPGGDHLAIGDQPHIGRPDARRRHREARHEGRREPLLLDQPRGQCVGGGGNLNAAPARQQRPQPVGRYRLNGSHRTMSSNTEIATTVSSISSRKGITPRETSVSEPPPTAWMT